MGEILISRRGGGEKVTYNSFCQPTEPATKTGIWLKATTTIKPKKIVFDDAIWASQSWLPSGTLPNLPSARLSACCAAVDHKIFLFGGQNGVYLNTAISFNADTKAYSSIANMPTARNSHACATYGSEVFIFGGDVTSTSSTNTAIAYNPSANTYRSLANMPSTLNDVCCAVLGDKIYIFGMNASNVACYAYNPATNNYQTLMNPAKRILYACCTAYGDEVFIFGGYSETSQLARAYKPSTNTFRDLANLPVGIAGGFCEVVGNEIFIFCSGWSSYMTQVYAYNPATDNYRLVVNSGNGRYYTVRGAKVYDSIYAFGTASEWLNTDCMMLTAKQYPDNPSFLLYTLNKDVTFSAFMLTTKLIDALPVYFKDAMLFADGNITFPALYIGNGTSWVLARAAQ